MTFVCDIFAQVIYAMENSECCVGEDVSLTPDATDDACITQFIEIVPVQPSWEDFPNTQVKVEFVADIKQEPEDLYEVYGASIANVSLCVFLCHDYCVAFFSIIVTLLHMILNSSIIYKFDIYTQILSETHISFCKCGACNVCNLSADSVKYNK